ncbi:hypothetical protein Ptr902_04986 [Pyrenophora tritici-repentis]|nr:hypothetical protein PtrV1_04599 [Pyrenophora tritici-repentis]KAF7452291.1 hypothetical protein A1F99_040690 [Pyrenophora tritici-repentis]KAI1542619.1 hypothetical protein PtrSN001A_003373 [Pyrenophora tritici-repentis]KAI1546169.1 hypothetical protein PtrSN001C_002953 [Pyrenophora tritici-repentis]KAI1573994.1 hypothetical protein PtrEW4_003408 [Pyrenophora tritici-repentis]
MGKANAVVHTPMQYNLRSETRLANTLFIAYRDTFLDDGSRPNEAVAAITRTQPGEYHE